MLYKVQTNHDDFLEYYDSYVTLVIGNIGPGAGEGSRLAVGSTILGGMIISTFFTLYITPTMYLALAKNTKRIDAVDIELKKQLN